VKSRGSQCNETLLVRAAVRPGLYHTVKHVFFSCARHFREFHELDKILKLNTRKNSAKFEEIYKYALNSEYVL